MNTVKQLKSGKYAVVENGRNVLVTNNYGDIPDKRRAILAAASPALLEACQYTLDNLEAAINEKLITAPRNFQIQLDESRKKLRAAIVKAEGK